jgi:hypothetical protein
MGRLDDHEHDVALAVPEFVFASGDKKLRYACEQLGMTTADTNAALG